ncbi:hypothetical protein W97_03643 [Coniosporium apollinis CBS 100218]|uniref:INO80 complex subunit F domain-containing protein n=1 Tax=Coniosporium apollinis (strain CBS 100218) TaxID=1168221 RepID=R7YR65_CONA1|nr:uncharacterized protein W97_03643 [Coniosporium apollinis CBS 100218]EON64412.1 hypothetical protein W97_03643 [Coniosporium apollinis CBS 100218]
MPIREKMRINKLINSNLPPSVEEAYHKKCIELKRRINEVEANNDAARLRKTRVNRAIMKLRLERAMLLEQLEKRMEANVDESDRSTSPPPTILPDKYKRSKPTGETSRTYHPLAVTMLLRPYCRVLSIL